MFKSRYAIVTPGAPGLNISRRIRDEARREALLELAQEAMDGSEAGLIVRSSAAGVELSEVARDIGEMRSLCESVLGDGDEGAPELLLDGPDAHLLAWRDWPEPDILADAPGSFETHGVHEMIATLLGREQCLKGGATLSLEPTRALVAVDVNTAGDTSPAAGLKANIAAARELARLLRCRGLGGQIVIDFAPLAHKDRKQLESVLAASFRKDPVETSLVGWTRMGLFELQRKRERQPITREMIEP